MEKISLLILNNQLRLHDNPLWVKAFALGHPVLAIWISPDMDKRHIHIDTPRMGGFRMKFLFESFFSLKKEINYLGGTISAIPEKYLELPSGEFWKEIPKKYSITDIIYPIEPGFYEENRLREIKSFAKDHQITVHCIDCNSLFSEDKIIHNFSKFPSVFTEFRKKLEVNKNFPIRDEISKPEDSDFRRIGFANEGFDWLEKISQEEELKISHTAEAFPDRNPRGVLDFKGGEKEGLLRLQQYIWEKDLLQSYKETRNGLLGGDYSSKFSPWLAIGCLSPIRIYNEILGYEKERVENESTYWLKFELLWKEFFRWIVFKNSKKVFSYSGIRGRTPVGLERNTEVFERWRLGQTEDDFVDANMRELLLTGFMSNRGRQNVASFLVHGLNLDWRWGAEWFETQLIDYDVASNWGNWNYVAGVGNDPRNRVFNTTKQANDYDPTGEYRNFWLDTRSNSV